jgi:hypothetical protein
MELLLVLLVFIMSYSRSLRSRDTQRSGTTPLANQLNVCYAVSMTDEEGALMQAEYEAECYEASASQFTSCPQPLDFPTNLCHTKFMTYTRQQLIDALQREYEYLCHDCPDDDDDLTTAEYAEFLQSLTLDELIDETSCEDDSYTLDEYLASWS